MVTLTVIASALININVRLYGDDFVYSSFTSGDMNYFITAHIHHYFQTNGRAVVHVLAALFLGLDIRIWQILNSCMIGGLLYFGTKTVSGQTKDDISANDAYISAFIFAISIAFFHIDMTRQSVYWLTGSFNYTYPVLALLVYWYSLTRYKEWKKAAWVLPLTAFISAATVEQVSLMTFGLTLLIAMEQKIAGRGKLDRPLVLSLASATTGMLTVVLAPSVFVRASAEHAPVTGFMALLQYNLGHQGSTLLFSEVMMPYHVMAILPALGIVWVFRDKSLTGWRTLDQGMMFYGLSAALCWFWRIMSPHDNTGLFIMFVGCGLIVLLSYAAVLVYKNNVIENNFLPVLAVVLCFGSQAMMLISPVYGYRNLFPSVIMLVLYSAALMPRLKETAIPVMMSLMICFIFHKPWLVLLSVVALVLMLTGQKDIRRKNTGINTAIAIAYISITLVAARVMQKTIDGYAANAQVYNANLQLAQERMHIKTEGALLQSKLPKAQYAWAMPYTNPYYIPFYNRYIGVDKKTEINWKE